MASNVLYPSGSYHLLRGDFHLCTSSEGQFYSSSFAALISSSYTYSALHEYFSGNLASGLPGNGDNLVGASASVPEPSCVSGTLFDAGDITFSSVAAGSVVNHIVIWQSGSGGTNDYLLAHFDTGSGGTGINISTNGGDITIQWNASGILALSGGC